jgi:hypothetical protein
MTERMTARTEVRASGEDMQISGSQVVVPGVMFRPVRTTSILHEKCADEVDNQPQNRDSNCFIESKVSFPSGDGDAKFYPRRGIKAKTNLRGFP